MWLKELRLTPIEPMPREPDDRSNPRPVLSVVIPMYREASRIGPTLEDAVATLRGGGRASEIILVDDGSPDGTVNAVKPWVTDVRQGNLERVVLVKHGSNRGKGAAVRTGMAAARGEWRLMMDADNAARVGEVERLMAKADLGVSMVCGSRNTEDAAVRAQFFRKASGLIFRAALGLMGLNLLKDTQCGFKLYRRDVAELVTKLGREDRFAFDLEHLLLAKKLGRIVEVGIAWEHKTGGTVNPIVDGLKMLREAARIRWRFLRERPAAVVEVKPSAASRIESPFEPVERR